MHRAALTGLLVVGLAASALVPAVPAAAAAGTISQVLLQPADRESTDPVTVDVAALDADGGPVAFTGSLTLRTGRASSTVRVSGDGTAEVDVATRRLSGGWATLVAVLRAPSGRTTTVRRPWFVQIVPSLAVAAFGCTAIAPGGGAIRFAVTRMADEVIRTPNSRVVPLLPYIAPSGRRSLMIDQDWRPLRTSGRIVVRRGAKAVATLRLASQVRRLVFGATWNGRVRGRFTPGAYRAALTLVDATGRTSTAVATVQVVRRGLLPCTR